MENEIRGKGRKLKNWLMHTDFITIAFMSHRITYILSLSSLFLWMNVSDSSLFVCYFNSFFLFNKLFFISFIHPVVTCQYIFSFPFCFVVSLPSSNFNLFIENDKTSTLTICCLSISQQHQTVFPSFTFFVQTLLQNGCWSEKLYKKKKKCSFYKSNSFIEI